MSTRSDPNDLPLSEEAAEGDLPPALVRSRRIARIMDEWVRIPGTDIRVGLDPLLGFVPGLGDWIAWIASGQLLWSAWRIGASAPTLLRMTGHLLIDGVVGTVPIVGDLFDIGWRANTRNLRLLERQVREPDRLQREGRWLIGVLLALIGAVGVGSVWVAWWVFTSVIGLLGF